MVFDKVKQIISDQFNISEDEITLSTSFTDDLNAERDRMIQNRIEIVSQCDVLIDGQFVDELKDITLKWRGSSNQRVIDVKKSLHQNKVILYCD